MQHIEAERIVPALLGWFAKNSRDLPWRRTRDPYAIWVSEIMLQQTQVNTVIPYWNRWMRELPNMAAVANAPLDKLYKLWEGLGYYTRVRNLQKAAQTIVRHHRGEFPNNFEEVLGLPGIGRYTAGAICSIAFNQPTPILDGNVIRVLCRLYGIAGDPKTTATNAKLWRIAERLVRHSQSRTKLAKLPCSALNQSLMELGAMVCLPGHPRCDQCPVRRHCFARRQNRVHKIPRQQKRAPVIRRNFIVFIVNDNGRFLVQRRPAGSVNGQLWEFPNVEDSANSRGASSMFQISGEKPLCRIRHSITRSRIVLEAFNAKLVRNGKKAPWQWKTIPEMDRLAFPSAHRKILQAVASSHSRRLGHGNLR